jgi:hypothetical protein
MEKFTIKLADSRRSYENNYYVEYVPNNDYDDDVKKCDTIPYALIQDPIYLEEVRIELYGILEDKFGADFTSKYSL